ncbi:MAG TPA: hypothetical protein DEQ02_06320 [Ruminococcaceae bacterium]|nr:hypothetical protein [Oscillospiraceae bacterium]
MFETILYLIILFFALIGVVDIIQTVVLRLLIPKTQARQIVLLMLKTDDAEVALRHAVEKTRAARFSKREYILAVDCGLSAEMLEVCRKLSQDSGCVAICKKDELLPVLENVAG